MQFTKSHAFEQALIAMIFSADYIEYCENKTSPLYRNLLAQGYSESDAERLLTDIAVMENAASDAFWISFEAFGVEEEFEEWKKNLDVVDQAQDTVLELIQKPEHFLSA